MRSSTLLSAAFALGALAGPLKRGDYVVVTDTDVIEETVTVYVTATGPPAVSEPTVTYTPIAHDYPYSHSHYHYYSQPAVSSPAPVESSVYVASTPAYTPPASSAPASSALASSAPASSAPAYTPAPSSTPAPVVSSAVYSSAAPASSASYAGGVGPAHVTGDSESDITSGQDYIDMVLYHHNANRANHGAGLLTWDTDLVAIAQPATNCSNWPFKHTSTGQNMAASGPIANVSAGITEGWVNGEEPNFAPYYGQSDPSENFESWGHFTQVVWKSATKVGCYTNDCTGATPGMWITVCNYDTGNVAGKYGDNVGQPITDNLIHWTD